MTRASPRSSIAAPLLANLVLACVTATTPVDATPRFPEVLASHLALAIPPECSLCHTGTPGRNNATTTLGKTLRSRGLSAYDEASLRTALDALAAEKKDSDGDGIPDVEELQRGGDPNSSEAGERIVPEYGCALATGRVRDPICGFAGGVLVIALAAASVVRRSSASRHRGRGPV